MSNPESKDLTDKVVRGFMRKAFLTDAVLYLVLSESSIEESPYAGTGLTLRGHSCRVQVLFKESVSMINLLPQADYYIVGTSPEEWLYLKIAAKNGVNIIGLIETEEEMFADIPINPQVEELKKVINSDIVNTFRTFPPNEYEYFLFHNGLGESLGFFYWLKEYRKTHHKKILLFCISDSHISLMNLSPYVDLTIKVSPIIFDYLFIYFSEDYGIKNFCSLYNDTKASYGRNNRIPYAELPIIGLTQDYLGISPAIKFERYNVNLPEQSISNAQKVFNELGLVKGHSVFLITEGISQKLGHHKDFWVKLAARLREEGFETVTNSTTEIIPGCKNLFLPLADSVAFAGLCGYVASQPTGFSEAICSINSTDNIKLYIIRHSKKDIKETMSLSINFVYHFHSLRYYGRQLQKYNAFQKYVSLIMPPNVKFSLTPFGDTAEEDDAIIENLVRDMLS